MNYISEKQIYYKVTSNGELLSFGVLEPGQVLSTIHNVTFITEEEYDILNSRTSQ